MEDYTKKLKKETWFCSGTVHALNDGLVAEIQQSSDLTYRLFDYDRTDADGKRPLHIDKCWMFLIMIAVKLYMMDLRFTTTK